MKNLFIQKSFGHCTVYALANMFRDDFFVKNFLTDEYKGCDDEKEKHMLSQFDKSISIADVISIRHGYNIPIPEELVYKILLYEDPVRDDVDYENFDTIPYLLGVRRVNSHKYWHSVVVLNRHGVLYFIEPYNEDIIRIDENLFDHFKDCWSIRRLCSGDEFLRISSKTLGFDLL